MRAGGKKLFNFFIEKIIDFYFDWFKCFEFDCCGDGAIGFWTARIGG